MDPNGMIVLGSKLNYIKKILIVKIAFKNESYELFFQEVVLIAQKTRLSITFS